MLVHDEVRIGDDDLVARVRRVARRASISRAGHAGGDQHRVGVEANSSLTIGLRSASRSGAMPCVTV